MAKKPLILLSFSIAAVASAFIIDGYSAPSARAQKTGAEAISPSVTSPPTAIGQKTYPTIASDAWLAPSAFSRLAFNTPVLVDNKGGKQHLALISRDMLNPPQSQCTLANLKDCGIAINKPGREVRLVIQWRQSELRAWAYERSEVDNTPPQLPKPPNSSTPIVNPPMWSNEAKIITYSPSPEINEGLHSNLSWEAQCGSTSCLFKPLPPVPLTPPVFSTPELLAPPNLIFCPPEPTYRVTETLPDGIVRTVTTPPPTKKAPSCVEVEVKSPDPQPSVTPPQKVSPAADIHRLTIYISSQEFKLDGKDGVFPINAPLAKALREAKSSAVKIITPRKWEATINPEAVKNLSVIYKESSSSQTQR
ncbi:hypothetical protein [Phormidesmis priestleyi]